MRKKCTAALILVLTLLCACSSAEDSPLPAAVASPSVSEQIPDFTPHPNPNMTFPLTPILIGVSLSGSGLLRPAGSASLTAF